VAATNFAEVRKLTIVALFSDDKLDGQTVPLGSTWFTA
jgi:hypothetical protein